jgi:hypothetical protein
MRYGWRIESGMTVQRLFTRSSRLFENSILDALIPENDPGKKILPLLQYQLQIHLNLI